MALVIKHSDDVYIEFDLTHPPNITVSDYSGSLGNPHNMAIFWPEAEDLVKIYNYIGEHIK